jgi:hypothetical protein
MIVTSMTVGAANTTGTARSLGTLLGGVFALIFWALSAGSAVALAFCGWLVSFGSFYTMLILNNPPLGRTTLLAWNVTVLYAYSLMQRVDDDDDDEGGTNPLMGEIVYHRLVSVNLGILWGIIVCRAIWPISGRRKFKEGLTVLYLQLGLIWKRGPLAILLRSDNTSSYMKDGEEKALQRYGRCRWRVLDDLIADSFYHSFQARHTAQRRQIRVRTPRPFPQRCLRPHHGGDTKHSGRLPRHASGNIETWQPLPWRACVVEAHGT